MGRDVSQNIEEDRYDKEQCFGGTEFLPYH